MRRYSLDKRRWIIGGLLLLTTFGIFAQSKDVMLSTTPKAPVARDKKVSLGAATTKVAATVVDTVKSVGAVKPVVAKMAFKKLQQMSFYVGYGLSAEKIKPTFGGGKKGGGLLFGADYILTFHKHWAFTAGLDFTSYNSKFVADGVTTQVPMMDSQESFILISKYSGWVEKQTLYTLGIPLTIRYYTQFSPKWSFFIGTGLRTSFATGGYSQVTGGNVALSARYERLGLVYEDVPYQGFMDQSFNDKKSTAVKINLSSITDFGFTLHLNPKWSIYAATYIEYGLLNLKNDSYNEPLVAYNASTDQPYYNHVPYSNTIDKTNTMAIGGKVGLTLTFGASKGVKSTKPVTSSTSKAVKSEVKPKATTAAPAKTSPPRSNRVF